MSSAIDVSPFHTWHRTIKGAYGMAEREGIGRGGGSKPDEAPALVE